MGRKSDKKQGDPTPLAGSSKPNKEGTSPPKKRRSGGKNKPLIKDSKSGKENRKKEGKAKSAAVAAAAVEAEQIDGLEEENEELAASRAAYFDPADLEEETAVGAEGFGDLDDLMAANGLEEEEEVEDEFLVEDGLDALEDGSDGLEVDDAAEIPQASSSRQAMDDEVLALPRLKGMTTAGEMAQEDLEMDSQADFDEGSEPDDLNLNLLSNTDETEGPPSVQLVKARMASAVRALSNWKSLGAQLNAQGKSRSDVYDQFISDVCEYYGYNTFLAEKLVELFPIEEAVAFLDASDTPRPVTIRTNTLRTRRRELAQALINRGVNLEPIGKWSKVGLQVFESGVPIGATPEYLAGHYILQSASSFLPVMALAPQPNERVLDMSAAPGGKTTYISALLQNTGTVFANDSNKTRSKSLAANVARMGCKNVIICNYDGREFPKVMGGFDRVLLDAPCSGTGVISKDPSVKINKTARDFVLLSHLQKQLILCAIDSVKPGGHVVYSTCSVTVDENEAVVSYALKKRPHVKLVETGIDFGREGFKSFKGKDFGDDLKKTRRFLPHVVNMEGFFCAKLSVGKPSKAIVPASETAQKDAVGEELGEAPEMEEAVTFDNAEDAALIESGRIKKLKRKGIKVVGEDEIKAKKAKKAAKA